MASILLVLLSLCQIFAESPQEITPEHKKFVQRDFRLCESASRKSCGLIQSISKGESNYNNPFLAHIPRYAKVRVKTFCDSTDAMFYTTVQYQRSSGSPWIDFVNPYKSNGSSRWLSTPGIYNCHKENFPGQCHNGISANRTQIFTNQKSDSGRLTRHHVTSLSGTPKMFKNVVWVDKGMAYYGLGQSYGYGATAGGIGLSEIHSKALFDLVRHVGTNSVVYSFDGYGPSNPETGEPVCAGPYDKDGKPFVQPEAVDRGEAIER